MARSVLPNSTSKPLKRKPEQQGQDRRSKFTVTVYGKRFIWRWQANDLKLQFSLNFSLRTYHWRGLRQIITTFGQKPDNSCRRHGYRYNILHAKSLVCCRGKINLLSHIKNLLMHEYSQDKASWKFLPKVKNRHNVIFLFLTDQDQWGMCSLGKSGKRFKQETGGLAD